MQCVCLSMGWAVILALLVPALAPADDILAEHMANMAGAKASLGLYAVNVDRGYTRLLFPWDGERGRCAASRDTSMVLVVAAFKPEPKRTISRGNRNSKTRAGPTPMIKLGHVDSVMSTVWEPGHRADPVKDRYIEGGSNFYWPVWSLDDRRALIDAWGYLVVVDRKGNYQWFSSGDESGKVMDKLTRGGKRALPDNVALDELPAVNFRNICWAGKGSSSIISTCNDAKLRTMDVKTGRTRVLCETPDRKGIGHPSNFAVSGDLNTVAFFNDRGDRGGVYVWRKGRGKLRRIVEGRSRRGALSPDGRYLVCAITRSPHGRPSVTSTDLFRTDTGKLVWSEAVTGLSRFAFDSKGKRIACNGSEGGSHIIVTPVEHFEPRRLVSRGREGYPIVFRSWSADDTELIYHGTPPE